MKRHLLVFALALAAGMPGNAHASGLQVRPELAAELASHPGAGHIVLVSGDTEAVRGAIDRAGLATIEVFDRLDVAAAYGGRDAILRLHREPGIVRIDANVRMRATADSAHKATGVEALRSAPGLGALRRPDGTAWDGTGVSIAVIDGAFDHRHEMFVEDGRSKFDLNLRQACATYNPDLFVRGAPDVTACSQWIPEASLVDHDGHGTHVAGIAGGYRRTTPAGRPLAGVAPGARLVGLGTGAGLAMYNVVSALNWVLEHHANPCGDGTCVPIRVLNNSWGLPSCASFPCLQDDYARGFEPDLPVNRAVTEIVQDGVVVVFAAGNDGGDGTENRMNYFAQNPIPGMIGVANFNDGNAGDQTVGLSSSSSRGRIGMRSSYPDVAAPGEVIFSSCPSEAGICAATASLSEGEYAPFGGTSMAAPHVAGLVALLLEADPTLTPGAVEDLLEDTARTVGDPARYEPDVYVDHTGAVRGNPDGMTSFDGGHGLVDAVAALDTLLNDGNRTAPVTCPVDLESNTVSDPAGDAWIPYLPAARGPSSPSFDIVSVTAKWHGQRIEVALNVDDLPETANGKEVWTLDLSVDGRWVAVDANRDPVNGVSFTVFQGQVTVTGAFEPDQDRIRYEITPAAHAERANVTTAWSNIANGGTLFAVDTTGGGCSIWH